MSGKGGKRKSGKLPPFVPLLWDMLNSPAYKDLAPSSAKVLPYFLGKPKINMSKQTEFYGANFNFTYSEAKKYGFASKTYERCLIELLAKGFIDIVWKGGIRGESKTASRYRNSLRWKNYSLPDFKTAKKNRFVNGEGYV
ncbi:MAG: hypothetical protein HQK91_12745 [Nitrospirae bacterium]|nr:hypothetical protein [Nitrospirota bacterium]